MPDLNDGQSIEMQGSGSKPYILKNVGGVYSCTCPAWRNQSAGIEARTCKHLRKLRGDDAEQARCGAPPQKPDRPPKVAPDGSTIESSSDAEGPPILLAESWDKAADLTGWWMSEKLDGVRAYWDGKQFLSRLGNLYHAPDWFIKGFPDFPLDGELWIDRKAFQRTVSIVRRQDKSDHWKDVRYLVFDAPSAPGGFEDRIAFVKHVLGSRGLQYARAHEHQICRDVAALKAELARVEALGGEGLMLRQPGSKYHAGRSSTLLKVKSFLDAEALVIGHQDGAGRHKGRVGALLVRLANGIEFGVGTGLSDAERDNPPPIGSTITFRYQELSDAGVPRFPSFLRVREDHLPAQSDIPSTPVAAGAISASTSVAAGPAPTPPTTSPTPVTSKPAEPVSKPVYAKLAAASATGGSVPRYFEFKDDKSSKFWEVKVNGADLTTRWGRISTDGQSKTKSFPDSAAAAREMAKLIESKTKEGYVGV